MVWLGPQLSDCDPVWDPTTGHCVSLGLDEEIKAITGDPTTTLAGLFHDSDPALRGTYRHMVHALSATMDAIRTGQPARLNDFGQRWIKDEHPHLWAALERQATGREGQ